MAISAALVMTPPAPRRCPTNHRNITEDGYRVVREDGKRWAYVLGTCRDCGQRLSQRWEMRRNERQTGQWYPDVVE